MGVIRSLIASLRNYPRIDAAFGFAADLRHEWNDDRCSGLSAEIAFWLVLSLFPGLLVLGSALSRLDSILGADIAERTEAKVIEGIEAALGSESGPISSAATDLFNTPSAGALTFGVIVALFGLSRGFNAVVGSLDVAYDIEVDRSWFHARVTALFLGFGTVVVGALTLVVLFVGPLLGRGGQLGTWFNSTWQILGPLVAFVALVGWATTIFHVAPLHLTKWRWDVPGAIVAAVFWLLATFGFRIYIDSAVGGSNAILGAVGGVLTLLLWVYVLAIGLLLGAEINQLFAEHHGVSVTHIDRRTVRGSTKEAAQRARRMARRSAKPISLTEGTGGSPPGAGDAGDPPVT